MRTWRSDRSSICGQTITVAMATFKIEILIVGGVGGLTGLGVSQTMDNTEAGGLTSLL
jgi:hypothetical protein